jgi:hypothetical protein
LKTKGTEAMVLQFMAKANMDLDQIIPTNDWQALTEVRPRRTQPRPTLTAVGMVGS